MDRIPESKPNKPSENTRNQAKRRHEFSIGPSENTRQKVRIEGDVPHRETPLKPDSNVNISLDDHSAIINFERDISNFDKDAKEYQARFEALKQKYQDYGSKLQQFNMRVNSYIYSRNLYFARKQTHKEIAELSERQTELIDLSVPISEAAVERNGFLNVRNEIDIYESSNSDSEEEQDNRRELRALQNRVVTPTNRLIDQIANTLEGLEANLTRMDQAAHGLPLPDHLKAVSIECNQLRNEFNTNLQEGLRLEEEKQPLLHDYPHLKDQRERLKEVQQKRTRLFETSPEESHEAILADNSLSPPESLPTVHRLSRQ